MGTECFMKLMAQATTLIQAKPTGGDSLTTTKVAQSRRSDVNKRGDLAVGVGQERAWITYS